MGDSPYSELKSSLSPMSPEALNFSSRRILANYLNTPQTLLSEKGFNRDYTGLAECMGFRHSDIVVFEVSGNPTLKILESWQTRPNATLDKLLTYLEDMERHDVIEVLIPLLKRNVEDYLEYQKSEERPIQDNEVTSGLMNSEHSEKCATPGGLRNECTPGSMDSQHSQRNLFTRHDLMNGECTKYDAYVSHAYEETDIADEIAQVLESVGFKICISGRDVLAGCSKLDTDIELIANRCRRVVVLLSPNFIRSPQLEFQVSFAASLGIEQKQRILIPVILEQCEIPKILKPTIEIDFAGEVTLDRAWNLLVLSLLDEKDISLTSGKNPFKSRNVMLTSPSSLSVETRSISQPPSHSLCSANNSDSCSETKDSVACSDMIECTSLPSRLSPSSKKLMSFLKRKRHLSCTSSASFSPSATSEFHSLPCSDMKNLENSSDRYFDSM